jgi:hypothetical protein
MTVLLAPETEFEAARRLPSDSIRSIVQARDALGPIRMPPDPFALLDVPLEGCRPSMESIAAARELSISIDGASVIDEHVLALAVAPTHDLHRLKWSNCAIMFANSFLAAADSEEANWRRQGPLREESRRYYESLDLVASDVFGLYDQEIHALIFTPVAYPINHERVTLHELGHALTMRSAYRVAHLRSDLLCGLPPLIQEFLTAYPQGSDRASVRERVLEVLAEAYVWTIVGRWAELPSSVQDALHGVLNGSDLRQIS